MSDHFEAIVVGAGIIGSSTAFHLAKLGKQTLLIEKFALGHDHGSSHGKSRIIRYAHTNAPYIPLVHEAYKQWAQLEEMTGEKLWSKTGLLWISDKSGTAKRSKILIEFGFEHEILSGTAISKRFPQFSYDDTWQALYDPNGGVVYADRCLRAIQDQFRKLGGTIHENENVLSISSDGKVHLQTDKSTYTTSSLVVCVGSWLPKFFPDLPIKCQPERLALCFWRPYRNHERYQVGQFPCFIITRDNGPHFFGQPCVDYPDQIKVCYDNGLKIDDPDAIHDDRMHKWDHSVASEHLSEHFPDIETTPATVVTCSQTLTPDFDYIIDAHPMLSNVFIGGGFSGTGFKLAPAVGFVLARMTVGDTIADIDLSAFRLDRPVAKNRTLSFSYH